MMPVRIGTRGSALARWQADWVETALRQQGVKTQIIEISTSGDKNQQGAIANLGTQGVFTKEIQRALLNHEIDLAVHSLKDLPTESVDGLEFVASPRRGPFRDAFVSNCALSIDQLPHNTVIGTGSVRRQAQIRNRFGTDYQIVDIRGNVETRLRKLDDGEYDAIILAEAGLVRLGFEKRIVSYLEPPLFLPAIGQGALGLEVRADDVATCRTVMLLNDTKTYAAVLAERSLLAALRGGCLAPVAAWGTFVNNQLTLVGRVLSPNGEQQLEHQLTIGCSLAFDLAIVKTLAIQLGRDVAQSLIDRGAQQLLQRV